MFAHMHTCTCMHTHVRARVHTHTYTQNTTPLTIIPPAHALIYTLPLHYWLDFYPPRTGTLLPIGSATSPLQLN